MKQVQTNRSMQGPAQSRVAAMAFSAALALGAVGCGDSPDLVIAGSDTMQPMMDQILAAYKTAGDKHNIVMRGFGSNAGMRELLAGTADVAVASREVSDQERVELSKLGEFTSEVIAYDCLVLVVHPENPIKSLSLREVSDIFSGRIKNWREIGGPNLPITLVVRDENSGSATYFREHVLQMADLGPEVFERERNRSIDPSAKAVGSNEEIAAIIEQDRGAIGYMGMASADLTYIRRVKPLDYSVTPREQPIAPTIPNVRNRTYRLSRPLFYVYLTKPNNRARDDQSEIAAALYTFITSNEGQKLVQRAGQIRALASELEVRGEEL